MATYFFYPVFFSIFFLTTTTTQSLQPNCPRFQCSNGDPDIRFPFKVTDRQPQHCGLSGFELVCNKSDKSTTSIHFPNYGDLVVKSISYDVQKLDLLDPNNCVHQVFLNLDLSLTPFRYYYVVKNYTYLNCSTRLLSPDFLEVPCLSGPSYHVYTVDQSSLAMLPAAGSCRAVKTVAIPFAYSPYLADNSFGLGLTWNLPESYQDFEATRGNPPQDEGFLFKNLVVGEFRGNKFFLCVLVVIALLSVKIYHSKKVHGHAENEKLLGP